MDTKTDKGLAGNGKLEERIMMLHENSVEGLLVNPWNRSLRLSRDLIRIVLGESR